VVTLTVRPDLIHSHGATPKGCKTAEPERPQPLSKCVPYPCVYLCARTSYLNVCVKKGEVVASKTLYSIIYCGARAESLHEAVNLTHDLRLPSRRGRPVSVLVQFTATE
jgi:hypothetical protein